MEVENNKENKEDKVKEYFEVVKEKVYDMFLMKKPSSQIAHYIATSLMKVYIFKSISGKKVDEIFIYEDGIFIEKGRNVIKEISENILVNNSRTNLVNEIINKIVRSTMITREELGCKNVNLICLNNGVLDIEQMKLLKHSPDYRFLNKIPVNYVKSARCSKIKTFISEVILEEDISAMQEWVGYLLYREYVFKNGVILVGEGDTGKTTFLNLLIKFIGENNKSGISLQKITCSKFSSAQLYEKHANIYDDLSANDIEDVGAFKMATGGGYFSAEIKFGEAFEFRSFAKLMFAANKIPTTKRNDDDNAYYNRWIVFRFENVFKAGEKKTNKFLGRELSTDEELSGFLNWALEGLKRLLGQKHFSYTKSLEEVKKMIQRSNEELVAFVEDCLIKGDETNWVSKEDLFNKYKTYTEMNNIPTITKEKFGRDITRFCDFLIDSRHSGNTGWRNVIMIKTVPIQGV